MLKRFVICYLLLLVPNLATAKIVFISTRSDGSNIYVMDDDGSNVQRLTFAKVPDGAKAGPTWSPDGKRIAFIRITAKGGRFQRQQSNLFLINQDGSYEQQLTNHPSLIVDSENKFTFFEIYVRVYDYGIFNRFTQTRA